MTTIVLHGFLAERFGREHVRYVATPAEAIRALAATLPGFLAAFLKHPHRYAYHNGKRGLQSLDEGHAPIGAEEFHIVPDVVGGNKVAKIVVGAVLIVAGFWSGGATWAAYAYQLGAALVISGVADFLVKTPKLDQDQKALDEGKQSYFFSGPLNVTAQGVPVPVLYGDVFAGSVVVSTGIVTAEVLPYLPPPPPSLSPESANGSAATPVRQPGTGAGGPWGFYDVAMTWYRTPPDGKARAGSLTAKWDENPVMYGWYYWGYYTTSGFVQVSSGAVHSFIT